VKGMVRAGDPNTPPVVVMFTCRNECEIAAIASLLAHASDIDIRIFYTGKTPLQACTLDVSHGATASSHSLEDGRSNGIDSELAMDAAPRAALPRMIESRALELTVWILAFFVGYWSIVRSPSFRTMIIECALLQQIAHCGCGACSAQ
jgi:hypothetical protein